MAKSDDQSSVYHIIMFCFEGSKTANQVFEQMKKSGKLDGYKIVAQGVAERDLNGKVDFHEKGKGGVGATVGLIAGGIAGALLAPVTIIGMAIVGATSGGIAGHFAGRAIPPSELKKVGASLPVNSSAFVALLEDKDAEKVIDGMKDYKANIVTITVGDELSGTIEQYVAAEIEWASGRSASRDVWKRQTGNIDNPVDHFQ